MESVEGFFTRNCSYPSQEQFTGLAATVQHVENSNAGSPMPVKCTKKLYNNFVSHVDCALARKKYDHFCTILRALRYIAKGSSSPAGFPKLLSFGLPKKDVCLEEPETCRRTEWYKATDDLLFTVSVVINFSDEAVKAMVPLLLTLLQCISSTLLPASARIEATRSSNSLLEVCELAFKSSLVKKDEVKTLMVRMDHLIEEAGDFELQVTTVECLFRLTTASERDVLATQWFRSSPPVLMAFKAIRESFFEVDCRNFLNLLNEHCGRNKTVISLPCKRAFLGSFELHPPHEEGLDEFWVDFNIATNNVSLYTEDMSIPGRGEGEREDGDEDDIWESVIIKNEVVKEWTVTSTNGELLVTITLLVPAHTLLHSLPPSPSHKVSITFPRTSDPTQPLKAIYGSSKLPRGSELRQVKKSVAMVPVRLNPRMKGTDNISPIEASPMGGTHISSQDSATPPHSTIPMATPATSTPKPHPLASRGMTPSTSSASRRLPLEFVSASRGPKASQSVSGIILGRNSRVVQRPAASQLKETESEPAEKKLSARQRLNGESVDSHIADSTGRAVSAPGTDSTKGSKSLSTKKQRSRNVQSKGSETSEGGSCDDQPQNVASKKTERVTRSKTSSQDESETIPPARQQKDTSSRNVTTTIENVSKNRSVSNSVTKPAQPKDSSTKSHTTATKRPTRNRSLSTLVTKSDQANDASVRSHTAESERLTRNRSICNPVTIPDKPKDTSVKNHATASGRVTRNRSLSSTETEAVTKRGDSSTKPATRSTTFSNSEREIPVPTVHPAPKVKSTRSNSSIAKPKKQPIKKSQKNDIDSPQGLYDDTDLEPSTHYDLPLHPREYQEPLKQSPSTSGAARKLHNTSLSSVGSGTSARTALSDISQACLNRGGQKRVFNLSGVTNQKKKKCWNKNKKPSSKCSSLNNSVVSEMDLIAIPDSLPTNVTDNSKAKAPGTARAKASAKPITKSAAKPPAKPPSKPTAKPTAEPTVAKAKSQANTGITAQTKPPIGVAKSTAASQASTGTKPRRICIASRDDDTFGFDESDTDMHDEDTTWELAPPKKKPKRNPVPQLPKQKPPPPPPLAPKSIPVPAATAKKINTSTTVLTSARTKNRPTTKPRSVVSSFDLSDSELEQASIEGRGNGNEKKRYGLNRSLTAFSELRRGKTHSKTKTQITNAKPAASPVPKGFTGLNYSTRGLEFEKNLQIDDVYDPQFSPTLSLSPDVPLQNSTTTKAGKGKKAVARTGSSKHQPVVSKGLILSSRSRNKKRVIDDIYGIESSLKVSPPSKRIDTGKPTIPKTVSSDMATLADSKKSTASQSSKQPAGSSSSKPSAAPPNSKKPPLVTSVRTSSGDRAKGRAKKPVSEATNLTNSTARALLHEFEEEEEEEMQIGDDWDSIHAPMDDAAEDRLGDFITSEPGEDLGMGSSSKVPDAPRKGPGPRPRRSSGYYSSHLVRGDVAALRSSPENSDQEEGAEKTEEKLQNDNLDGSFLQYHNHPPAKTASFATPALPPASQVGPDVTITSGFAQLCQSVVAQSGKKASSNPPSADKTKSQQAKGKVTITGVGKDTQNKRGQREETTSNVTLTQLSKEIVRSHCTNPSSPQSSLAVRDLKVLLPKKKDKADKYEDDKDSDAESVSSVESISSSVRDLAEVEENSELSPSTDEAGGIAKSCHISRKKDHELSLCSEEESDFSQGAVSYSPEVRALMATIGESLNAAKKKRVQKKKVTSSGIQRVPEELAELLSGMSEDRESVLKAFRQRLSVELDKLEKDVKRTISSEGEVTSFLRKKIQDLAKSRQLQQSQLCRLEALQVTFQEQMESLEENQSKQEKTFQQSLRKEMQNSRKRILAENQKKKLERIKRALQTMLLQVQ